MSLKVGELHATLGLKDRDFDRSIDKNGKKFAGFGKNVGKVAKGAAIAGGAALAGLAVQGLREFSSLEKGMNEVFTLLPDISDAAMMDMTGQVRDFSKEFGVLPDKVVPSLYQAISAGVPRENVFDFLETANRAAIGGVTDLETAVDGISSVVNSYGADVIDATTASDHMFTAVKLGKTNFDELSRSLFNVLPTASSLGVEFGDVTAAMAAMTSQGTPTNVATTQMRQMLVELSKAGSETSDMFKEISGESFKEFIAGGGNVQDALQSMASEAEKRGLSIADVFGSVEAGMAATALTSESGAKAFGGALDEMADDAGASMGAFDRMEQGSGRAFEKLQASANDLMLTVGEDLMPTALEFMETAETLVPVLSDAAEGLIGLTTNARPLIDVLTTVNGLMGDTEDESEGAADKTSILGAAFDGLMNVMNPLKKPYDAITAAMEDGDDASRDAAEGFSILGGEMSQIPVVETTREFSGQQSAIQDLEPATRALMGSAGKLTGAQDGLEFSTRRVTGAMQKQFDALRAQVDPIFALQQASENAAEAQDAVNEARIKFGEGSEEHLQAIEDAARANLDLKDAAISVRDATNMSRDSFIDQQVEMGLSREEAALLADQFESLDDFEFDPKAIRVIADMSKADRALFGSAPIPGRQHGGPVTARGIFEVGEGNRPELFEGANGSLFMLPGNQGRVLPFGDLNRMVASAEMMAQRAVRTPRPQPQTSAPTAEHRSVSFGDIHAGSNATPRDIIDEAFWQSRTAGF